MTMLEDAPDHSKTLNDMRPQRRRVTVARPRQPRATNFNFSWQRLALPALLAVAAVAYFWNLSGSGYGNDFYAAAVQAGTKSWKAMFFGSFDASNFITVDKPPASLWLMALSGRIFGFSSWSMLGTQAAEGVLAVALLYMTVKRWFGTLAGFAAGMLFALTPVAVVMFRFNNPDALLTLLLVAGAYCITRATEMANWRWLALAGVAIGFAFLTKMLQAFLVVPAFALTYFIAAPTSAIRRIRDLLISGVALIVSCGWWVAIVELWPKSSRPFIGGSSKNSILDLIWSYNGLSRLTGGSGTSGGPGGGGGMGGNFSGAAGPLRLFNSLMGGQIAWLIPAAAIALIGVLLVRARAPRTDRVRAAAILWGMWSIVTAVVFSYMQGVVHTYYTVALAPGLAALVAIGGSGAWQMRHRFLVRAASAFAILCTGALSVMILARTPSWHPWLQEASGIAAVITAAAVVTAPYLRSAFGKITGFVIATGLSLTLLGSAAFAASATTTPQSGSTPSAGPSSSGQQMGGSQLGGGDSQSNAALTTLLRNTAPGYKWAAVATSSQSAGPLQIQSGLPVMSLGGFNGQDGAITLAQFKQLVASHKIHYFIVGGMGGGNMGSGGTGNMAGGIAGAGPGGTTGQSSNQNSEIVSWIEATFTSTTIGGQTVYDLTT